MLNLQIVSVKHHRILRWIFNFFENSPIIYYLYKRTNILSPKTESFHNKFSLAAPSAPFLYLLKKNYNSKNLLSEITVLH
jgi:tricorn protease-like protein